MFAPVPTLLPDDALTAGASPTAEGASLLRASPCGVLPETLAMFTMIGMNSDGSNRLGWFDSWDDPFPQFIPQRLKYDQIFHTYGFGVTNGVCWHGLKTSLQRGFGVQLQPTFGMMVTARCENGTSVRAGADQALDEFFQLID